MPGQSRTVKRISNEYVVESINGLPITFETNDSTVYINGNLVVSGTRSEVASVDMTVQDNMITINDGETGNGVTSLYAGIEVDRGQQPFATLRWSELDLKWQISDDSITFANIATEATLPYITAVVDDTNPVLGGNLDLNNFSITNSAGNIVFNDGLQVIYQATAPAAVTGYTLIYASDSTGGGTGLFVSSDEFANQELVSKKKALAFSLLF